MIFPLAYSHISNYIAFRVFWYRMLFSEILSVNVQLKNTSVLKRLFLAQSLTIVTAIRVR